MREEKERETEIQALCEEFFRMPLIGGIRRQLREGLPEHLRYHNAEHTDDVIREALLFALIDGLTKREMEILVVAAAFHDSGFLVQGNDNETIGAELAADAMSSVSGYSKDDIRLVTEMIEDTAVRLQEEQLFVEPRSQLARYLVDADLSNLGRPDFCDKAWLVFAEQGGGDEEKFRARIRLFLEQHAWRTPAARKIRQSGKDKNYQLWLTSACSLK